MACIHVLMTVGVLQVRLFEIFCDVVVSLGYNFSFYFIEF